MSETNTFKFLMDYCEHKLDFVVTLPLEVKPNRDHNGKLKYEDVRDARLTIEVRNAKGHMVTQARQRLPQDTLNHLATCALADLKDRGFIK